MTNLLQFFTLPGRLWKRRETAAITMLMRLADGISESLPDDLAIQCHERVLAALRSDTDISLVLPKWFAWLLLDQTDGVIQRTRCHKSRAAIQRVGDLYQRKARGEATTSADWRSARCDAAAVADIDNAALVARVAARGDAHAAAAYAAEVANYRLGARVRQAWKLIELLEAETLISDSGHAGLA